MITQFRHFNTIFYLAIILVSIVSCRKADPLTYDHSANIYFDLNNEDKDSIVYTFAYNINKAVDTIFIPVSISGTREGQDRFYNVYFEKDSSTAVAGKHFEVLKDQYTIEANKGKATLPLVVYNIDELEQQSVSLILKLKESNHFNIENPKIIRAKVILSARLEQPNWWSMWLGDYSRVKHQLFIITTEQTSMTMVGLDAPKNLYFADLLKMMLRNPFKWIENNPDKGYELKSKDNGASYDFYHKDNPNKTILLKKNNGSGEYFFIDELGMEVR